MVNSSQERFDNKSHQKISDSFYVRGDGTRAYYFTEEKLRELFEAEGFSTECIKIYIRYVRGLWVGGGRADARSGGGEPREKFEDGAPVDTRAFCPEGSRGRAPNI
eukprot:1193237-Prorocentrum_minimum.AAC.1